MGRTAPRSVSGIPTSTIAARYGRGDFDGELLYIKPVLNGSEPRDVTQYSRVSDDFPHETTADQFFTESQFESYRILGLHEMRTIAQAGTGRRYPSPT